MEEPQVSEQKWILLKSSRYCPYSRSSQDCKEALFKGVGWFQEPGSFSLTFTFMERK